MSLRPFAFLLSLLSFACTSQTDKETDDQIKQVENSLSPIVIYGDSLLNLNLEQRMREKAVKGLSIAVIKDYKIVWAKGYGWADSADGRKVTTETRFQAASISKSLNSLAVMKLVQEGKLDPDADINNYLKSWQFPYDSVAKGKRVNTWNLLSHTAGLNVHGFPGYEVTDSLPTLVQLLKGEKPANTEAIRSVFEPGKEFQYSGGGTSISQLMLQDITGKSYDDYMEENVLRPMGMRNSSFRQPPTDKADYATGYYTNGSAVKGKFHIYPEQAAAGLWTTPTDLAKYIIECQLTLKGESQKVISQEMMQKRMTPYLDSFAAMGVFIENKPTGKFFSHTGGNEAFLCISNGSLEGGNGVVIMINGEDFSIIHELLHSVSRVYGWTEFYKPQFRKEIKLSPDSLHLYTGKYLLTTDTIHVFRQGEQLFVQVTNEPQRLYQLRFSESQQFSLAEMPDLVFRYQRDKQGRAEALHLREGSRERLLKRVD